MNKKVFIAMLVLTISFLTLLYVAKIFFPYEFVMIIQNEKLIEIGNFIDSHKWAYYLVSALTAFVTYWLYICACCGKKYLKWWECLIVVGVIGGSFLVNEYDATFAMYYSIFAMVILPAIFKGDLKRVAIVYPIHGIAQILSLKIRSLPLLFATFNSLIGLFMTFEMYLWLVLFYVIFNYNKKEN